MVALVVYSQHQFTLWSIQKVKWFSISVLRVRAPSFNVSFGGSYCSQNDKEHGTVLYGEKLEDIPSRVRFCFRLLVPGQICLKIQVFFIQNEKHLKFYYFLSVRNNNTNRHLFYTYVQKQQREHTWPHNNNYLVNYLVL